ncbi:MAG: Threonine dehydrogenase and related Zn-dependent dehydrogenase [Gammaproteobacteria bacterium]|jgi:L-iditol 2-dehydrogenase|nr:Threonine dehydrogenase and related Zn-dependent dehydrogenase [Gammaproteobacteria bacterium]
MLSSEGIQKSAVWLGPGQLMLGERPIPEVVPGSLLVKVHSCAICGSDLRIFRDGSPRISPPRVIGHEIAGEVVEIGKGVGSFKVGDRIAIGADVPCGECLHCLSGRPNCCDTNYAIGYQFEGGFSEYILLNPLVVKYGPIQTFSHPLSYDAAALAEPLACCINGYERGLMEKGRSVVIFGAGPIGMMLAMLAPIYEASMITIIDPNEERLQRAHTFGRFNLINPKKIDVVDAVMQLTQGLGADMIFTACPIVETHEQAIAMVAKRGVINFFGGLPKNASSIKVNSNFIHYREAYITGSHGSTPLQHKRALQLIEEKKVNVSALITHHYSLTNINQALDMALSGEALKVVIKPHV